MQKPGVKPNIARIEFLDSFGRTLPQDLNSEHTELRKQLKSQDITLVSLLTTAAAPSHA
jgi:hypothetical protein